MSEKILKADFHVHTPASRDYSKKEQNEGDGVLDIVDSARQKKLDVIAITDHNTVAGILGLNRIVLEKLSDITVLDGIELSLTCGHYLILGIPAEIMQRQLEKWGIAPQHEGNASIPTTKSQEKEYLKWAVGAGGLVIAAHPLVPIHPMSTDVSRLKEYFNEGLIHGAESHNAALEKAVSTLPYSLWHIFSENILKHYRIPAYANSDAHAKENMGDRHNEISVKEGENLLEGLRNKKLKIRHSEAKN